MKTARKKLYVCILSIALTLTMMPFNVIATFADTAADDPVVTATEESAPVETVEESVPVEKAEPAPAKEEPAPAPSEEILQKSKTKRL